MPIKNVSFKLKLDHGVLNIDPVDFELPAGRLAGQIHLNTGNGAPDTSMDIRLSDIHLDQFKSKKSPQAPIEASCRDGCAWKAAAIRCTRSPPTPTAPSAQ